MEIRDVCVSAGNFFCGLVSISIKAVGLRNSFVDGVGAIFSSAIVFVGVLFQYGLPLAFWIALLFLPGWLVWRRVRARRLVSIAAQP